MNHLTPMEAFLARLNALTRPQLVEAMRYLRGWNETAVDRALQFASMDIGGRPHRSHGEEMPCLNQDPGTGLICLAQRGHAGPVHVAYGKDDETVGTWPVQPDADRLAGLHATIADLVIGDRP